MATLSNRFRRAFDELLGGSTSGAEEIILLSKSTDVGGTAAASGVDDSTESLLGALRWGLSQYGLDLYSGYRFFCALARLGNMLPHTYVSPVSFPNLIVTNSIHIACGQLIPCAD